MKDLLKCTFAGRFNTDNFILFTKNLFNEIDIEPREISVPSGFGEHIKKFTYLGEYSDFQKRNIDVLVVELIGDTKVERARSFQRNLVAKFLKDNTKDAGLVAFYSSDNPDWRLSFVKMDYRITDKGVKVEVGTPPKRYSFLVGETEPSHTAQKQLFPILNDRKNNPLISEFEEAFSVEKVTREFYEKYRALFEKLAKNLNKNKSFQIIASKENIDIDNFAKKLLGQIVFLYFLQKKGWLGVPGDKIWGQGDKLFLRTLFDKAKREKKNFYNDYLEHLFYDTLNNPRRDEVDPAYSRYFDSKIPFLNGGLFEPDYDWANTIVYLENDIFENIIGAFDLYNFTVKEDEPLEKEVAVDPEMLGKVFENLLPENLRKGRGAYYTPREIVHYMCQESLINYLTTETKVGVDKIRNLVVTKHFEGAGELIDRALQTIKVCDPACGSGAFLVGMLHEIVSARRLLNHEKDEYHLKKETIQNCIYGVDIDPGAVEIAKLRLWLSLVVDYELKDIEPLPNLDYKIMCGNSLLEELIIGDESIKLFDERLLNLKELKGNPQQDVRQEGLKKQLQEKQKELRELYDANKLSMAKKKELDFQILAINKKLNPKARKTKSEVYHPVFFADQADEYFKRLRELHKQFFIEYDPVKKKERRKQIEEIELEFIKSSIKEKVDEFGSKIKNLNMQDPGDRKKQVVLMKNKLEYSVIPEQICNSRTKPYFLWKLNFFEVFQEKGGFDVVIANPPYVSMKKFPKDNNSSRYKRYLLEHFKTFISKSDLYCCFFERSLGSVSVQPVMKANGVLTFICSSTFFCEPSFQALRNLILDNRVLFLTVPKSDIFESALVNAAVISIRKNKSDKENKVKLCEIDSYKNILNAGLLDQHILRQLGIFLKDNNSALISIYEKFGLLNFNDEFITLDDVLIINNGIATADNDVWLYEKNKYISEKDWLKNKEFKGMKNVESFYRGETVRKWYVSQPTAKINYLPELMKAHKSTARPKTPEYFEVKKLVSQLVGEELRVAFDDVGRYFDINVNLIYLKDKNYDFKFILSFLNSRLFNFMIDMLRSNISLTLTLLYKMPIKKVSLVACGLFIKIVDKILAVTKDEDYAENVMKQVKVKEYERQIDQMVYKLYDLTEEEIKIVEGVQQ